MRLRLFLIIPGILFLVALMAFEYGLRKGRDIKTQEPEEKIKTDGELISLLLEQDLGERRFPFSEVISSSTGKKLIPVNPDNESTQAIIKMITVASEQAVILMNEPDSPVRQLRRINEASASFEEVLLAIIDADPAFSCSIPKTSEGKEQRSGYPDLRIEHLESKIVAYLDPKLYEQKSRNSSFRTFYHEPRKETSKVQDDAHHFLLGFAHDGNDGNWRFLNWELIDLAKLQVRLKAEFQASNRDLYLKEATLATSGP